MLLLFGAVSALSVIAFGFIIIYGVPFTGIAGINDALLKKSIPLYLALSVLGIFIVLGLTYIIATRLSKPLEELSRTVQKIEAGDLTARSSLTTSDEIGSLSAAFNNMAERIQGWHKELEKQVQERTEELSENERRFRQIVDSSPLGMHHYTLQPDGRLVFTGANPAADRILGVDNSQFIGKTIEEAFPPLAETDIPKHYRMAAAEGTPWYTEQVDFEHGKIKGAFEVRAFQTGRNRVAAMFHDITERKKAEEVLKESENKYRRLHESMRDGFVYVNMEGTILDFNESYRTILGYSNEELLRLPYDYITPQKWHAFEQKIIEEQVMPKGYSEVYEKEYRKKDGTIFPVELRVFLIKNDKGENEGMWAIVRDISERRKLEAQLLQAQKMESIGILAGGVAHDFNNALTAIIGFAYLLKSSLKEDLQLAENADQIISVSNRASMTVSSLLAFSRKQLISPHPVDLNNIVKEMEKLLMNIIGEDIEMIIRVCGKPLTVMADRSQIDQVLINLVTNARDAMPHGGCLTIETDSFYIDNKSSKTHFFDNPGLYGRLIVSDTGSGMEQKTIDMIFEPFFTTKEVGRGTGLGLAMVYGLVKQHNGNIQVYSRPQKGTTFTIYLPLIGGVKDEEKTAPLPELKGGTETILVAEDSEDVRKFFKKILEKVGYKVITAEDGPDALIKFNENKNSVRLCILDVIMPRKSGKAVLDEIRKTSPDIKSLFISGYTADVLDRQEILERGIPFLSKPISPDTLLRKVRETLDSDSVI